MFVLLRVLFILAVLGIGYAGFRYVRERDPRWLRVIRWIVAAVLALCLIFFIGLTIERLALP